ncbi:hypothetical protein MCERE19_01456 [Spirosomataceae bacterium]|jgi:hypothetical protein
MKWRLEKIAQLSGNKASVYSIVIDDENETLFEKFLSENKTIFKSEISDIVQRLRTIGFKTGAREIYFKKDEGTLGDGVCALYDNPHSNLRLYCIRYGTQIVVLGGGGHKPKTIRAFQESDKLKQENYLLRKISKEITTLLKEHEMEISADGLNFEGLLEYNEED